MGGPERNYLPKQGTPRRRWSKCRANGEPNNCDGGFGMRHKAIYDLYDNVVSIDDSTGAFDKDWNKVTIDEDAVTAKANELIAASAYIVKRLDAYPQIADQLDMLFHDMAAGKGDKTGSWYSAIAKVKSDNAKPE